MGLVCRTNLAFISLFLLFYFQILLFAVCTGLKNISNALLNFSLLLKIFRKKSSGEQQKDNLLSYKPTFLEIHYNVKLQHPAVTSKVWL